MKIYVEKNHIEIACQRNSHHCMIADAINDSVPKAKFILVDLQSIRWTDMENEERYIYLTPPIAQQMILLFDRGVKKIHPFSFNLNKPKIQKLRKKRNLAPRSHGPGEHRRGKVAYKDREFGIRKFKK